MRTSRSEGTGMGYGVISSETSDTDEIFCSDYKFKKVQEYPGRESSISISPGGVL